MDRRFGGGQAVPDVNALAAQNKVIEAQKELAAMQVAQQTRDKKVQNAINLILLPLQTPDGVVRQDPEKTPESISARAAAYKFLEGYFSTTTDLEAGIPVRELTAIDSPVLTA